MLEYSFDNEGNLLTEYLSGEGAGATLAFSDERPASLAENSATGAECIGMCLAIDDLYSIYSTYIGEVDKAVVGERIVINDGGSFFAYAIPEMHEDALERGNVQVASADEIFQMTVDEMGVNIFKLGKQTSGSMDEVGLMSGQTHE